MKHLLNYLILFSLCLTSWGQVKLVGMGEFSGGSIFAINEDGSEPEQWKNFVDPREPRGGIIESNGKLWGLTYNGGLFGDGTIYSTNLDGTNIQIVKSFNQSETGSRPLGDLLESNGKLWGMTNRGGANDFGVIFSIDTDGSNYTVVHNFDATNGSYPTTSLIEADGKLWGTTRTGGTSTYGIIFNLNTDGTGFTKVHDFGTPGANTPEGDLIFFNGKIWGTTSRNSIIFSIDTDGSDFATAHTFAAGENPSSDFAISGGKLWGMTYSGGTSNNGTIYTFDGTTYTKVHDFDDINGSFPRSNLIVSGEKLFGMTQVGGTTDDGTIFSIDADGMNFTKLHDFNGSNGSEPRGSLLETSNGRFVGVTAEGGNRGVIFSLALDGTDFQLISGIDNETDGGYPYGSLIEADGKLWGMTYEGGEEGLGVIFTMDRDGSNYTVIHDFFDNDDSGYYPFGSLVESNGKLWGMASEGGSGIAGDGIIFSIDLDGTNFTKVHDFDDPNGGYAYGSLTESNGKLWGMTNVNGTSDFGVIFTLNTDGTNFTKVHDFDGTNGAYPYGDLIENNGKLWGMTNEGGANDNAGIIFNINTDGTGFTKVHDFDDSDLENGSFPYGNLIQFDDKLWGMTYEGGANDYGTIFTIDTDGTNFTIVHDFDYSTGSEPYGSLTAYNDKLFGMTYGGGVNEYGVIFSYDPDATGEEYEVIRDFSGEIGGEPYYGSLLAVNTDVIAPSITSSTSFDVAENSTGVIYTVTTDEEATLSLGTSNDEALFTFTDGDISFISAPDFETPLDGDENNNYLIEFIAVDGAGNSNSQVVTINVTDVDETSTVLGIDDLEVRLYPNPVIDLLTIDSKDQISAQLLDLQGRPIRTQAGHKIEMDLRSLPSGIYLLKLREGNRSVTHRIIKTN